MGHSYLPQLEATFELQPWWLERIMPRLRAEQLTSTGVRGAHRMWGAEDCGVWLEYGLVGRE